MYIDVSGSGQITYVIDLIHVMCLEGEMVEIGYLFISQTWGKVHDEPLHSAKPMNLKILNR